MSDGDILNVRALEQGLEQMKRVANQDVTMKLIPGTSPYTSIVELTRTETAPVTVGISVDNGGYEGTGKWESSISTSWYNPLGLNDVLSYTYGKDIEKDDARLGSSNYYLSYSIPYGWYTFTASLYRNHFRQTVATLQPYLSSGVTEGNTIGIERVLRRNQTSKTSIQAQALRKERHNYIDDEEIGVQQQKTTAVEVGLKHRQYAGNTQADLYGYYRKGVGGWGAEKQSWEDGITNGTPRYSLWGFQMSLKVPVGKGMYSFRLVGQYAPMKLSSSEQLSIGGRYTVRGFDGEQSLSGERGAYMQHEFSYPLHQGTPMKLSSSEQLSIGGRYTVRGFDGEQSLSGERGAYMQHEFSYPLHQGTWTPYLGLDAGVVGGPSTEYEVGKVLVGAVLGVRAALSPRVQVDLHVGTPLYKPDGFRTGKTTVGFSMYAQL